MSHIRIIDISTSSNSERLSATLTIATINDMTGDIIEHPHVVAQGQLDIKQLIDLNQEIITKFKAQAFQNRYLGGIELPQAMICQVTDPVDSLKIDIKNLKILLDDTLRQSSWAKIREELIHSLTGINSDQLIRLVVRTNDVNIQSLPLERTSFVTELLERNNHKVSIVFDRLIKSKKLIWCDLPKVLLVLGSQKDIEQEINQDEIKHLFPSSAIVVSLEKPSREKLLKTIADDIFDTIIIVGHSIAIDDGTDGRININDHEQRELRSISVEELTNPFRDSVNNGLKLVILAGCSSIGLARALSAHPIGVPNVIAFRIPIHYIVLRQFFDRLLTKWTKESKSLEVALANTRAELMLYDNIHPGSSILPILFTSSYDPPLMFPAEIEPTISSDLSSAIPPSTGKNPVREKSFWQNQIGKKMKILVGLLIGLAIAIAIEIANPRLEATCNSIIGDGISCGEEIFNSEPSVRIQDEKQAGANAIAQGDYHQAVELLKNAWKAKKDPETLIMLQNAELVNQNLPIKSIALTIPGSTSTPLDIPTAMLKAVAYAQQQWNASAQTWKLQVVLVDDRNNEKSAPRLAENLLKRGVLAGIGSYSSVVTLSVKDVYQKHQTVLISGTSTSTKLSNPNSNTFFFRVCSNNQVFGKQIADYLDRKGYHNIALFRTPGGTFSDSMVAALQANSQSLNVVKKFDFQDRGLVIEQLNQAQQAGAQAIVLFPDAYTSKNPERHRVLSIVKANNGRIPIIGNEILKDQTIFNHTKQQIERLVISLSWHPSTSPNSDIPNAQFWGSKSQLDHRLAMNYDATKVIIDALNQLPINKSIIDSRKQIQQIISDPNYKNEGITGSIAFNGSDLAYDKNSLLSPKCDETKCDGLKPAI